MSNEKPVRVIAVSAADDMGLDGQVSAHFGRCPFYVVADVEDDRVTNARVVSNPNFTRHQPGTMPRFISGLGAQAIIAGGMGPRAIDMFGALGIEVMTGASGQIREALNAFLSGDRLEAAPCQHDGHHGCSTHDHKPPPTVAFTACGSVHGLNSVLDPRFGRAERFVLVDVEHRRVLEEFDNPLLNQAHGVGAAASSLVAGRGASAVVSSRFGPHAVDALEALGIEVYEAPVGMTVGEALQRFRVGLLNRHVGKEQRASK